MKGALAAVCGLAVAVACSRRPSTGLVHFSGQIAPQPGNQAKATEEAMHDQVMEGLVIQAGLLKPGVAPTNPSPHTAQAKSNSAATALSTHNVWFEGAKLYRDAILADPDYAPAYVGFGRTVLIEGNSSLAKAAFRSAIRIDPDNGPARFELGALFQMNGDMVAARSEWISLANRNPGYPEVQSRLAIASYFLNDFPAAEAYLEEANRRHQKVPPQFVKLLKEARPQP